MSGGRRILVVDDSAVVRRAVSELLTAAGYAVEAVASGEEAFERCLAEPFELLVSDVTMGALSGVQLCRLLKSDAATEALPIVLLTAADDPKSRFWGRHAGADAYVAKDEVKSALRPEVERLLEARPSRLRPSTVRAGRRRPLERLSEILEQHLFQAVVAREVRNLVHHLSDRRGFERSLLDLAAEVIDYAYLVLRLSGPGGESYAVHARGPFPEEATPAALAALGIVTPDEESVIALVRAPGVPAATTVESGEMALFPLVAAGERLGDLSLFGGRKRLAGGDRTTLDLLAAEAGVVVKSLFLMEETQRLAMTDGLTGLANRRRCHERLRHEVDRARRYGQPLSLALCDIDRFKAINDRFGHGIGDVVLKMVADRLSESVRGIDLVGRWGGEEFVVIFPSVATPGARIAAERLRSSVERAPAVEEGPDGVTISVGLASFEQEETPEALVERADAALYRAKRRGRNRVELA